MNASKFSRLRWRIERRAHGRLAFRQRGLLHMAHRAGAAPHFAGGRVVSFEMPDGRVVCMSARYKTEAIADAAIQRIQQPGSGREYKPSRSFFCVRCNGWHITAEEKRR